MHKVYSHENLAIVTSAKNLLEFRGIDCFIKNEHHGGGGHVGLEAVPIELWVHDSLVADEAIEYLENQLSTDDKQPDWTCKHCGEINAASFDICWKCQNAPHGD